MSSNSQILIEHSFHDVTNKKSAIEFCNNTILQLKKYFCCENGFIFENEYNSCGFEQYFITTPFEARCLYLMKGAWDIWSDRFSKYFTFDTNHIPHERYRTFDMVRALGQKECFLCDEDEYGNNSEAFADRWTTYFSIDEWKKEIASKIKEFDENLLYFYYSTPLYYDDYDGVYHDTFKSCWKRLMELEKLFPGYRIIAITPICGEFILAEKNGELKILYPAAKLEMPFGKLTGFNTHFHGVGFQLYKSNASAFFTNIGMQITPFIENQNFKWRWGKYNEGRIDTIEIYEKNSGKIIFEKSY